MIGKVIGRTVKAGVLKKAVATVAVVAVLSASIGCSSMSNTSKGAGVGAAGGATVGALIDKHNRWRGAVIGGLIGALLGGAFGKMTDDAVAQAAEQNRRVVVRKGDAVAEAVPVSDVYYNPQKHTHCRKVRRRIWKNGRLVMDRVEEVCKSEMENNEY